MSRVSSGEPDVPGGEPSGRGPRSGVRAGVRAAPPSRSLRGPYSRRVVVGVRLLCAALSLLVLLSSGVAWATFQNFKSSVPHGQDVPGGGTGNGADQNILLVGSDTRAGATNKELNALHTGLNKTTANADTMMVLHVPGNGGRATLVSFPRDSWVTIPGHGKAKLNAAYPDAYNAAKSAGRTEAQAQSAGLDLTIRTISGLTGLRIDHYMQVNLLGFYRISEAIGGVTVCLNHAANKTTETDDGTGSGFSGIDLPKGVSVIKGAQALAFVRQRHGLPHGDLDRIKRQQYFLKAAFEKITSAGVLLNPFKMRDLLKAVGNSLLVDPKLDLIKLAQQFQSLSSGKIDFATIPNNGPQLIYPDGVETSIVQVNTKAIPAFVKQLQGKTDDAYRKAQAAAPGSVTVDVLNATDTARLAARNAAQLRTFGFKINAVDSASPAPRTSIEYPPGGEAQAKAVAAVFPHAHAVATPDVKRVTVVLGAAGPLVKGLATQGPSAPQAAAGAASGSSSGSAASKPADPTHGLGCID